MRAAVQMVRDVLWKELDNTNEEGFRPDQVQAFFGGWSAENTGQTTTIIGSWMIYYIQTTAFPDTGMALHNGQTLGVMGLGLLNPLGGSKLPASLLFPRRVSVDRYSLWLYQND